MTQPILENQAIATIAATYTPAGLVLADGRKPRTYVHPKAKAWLQRQMLPLSFEGTFRVWPRYNRAGLKSLELVGIAPKEQVGVVAGKVVAVAGERVTVRVEPRSDRTNPFHVQLINCNDDLKPKPGWRTRFEVVWEDGELVITGSQPLHQGKPPAPSPTTEPTKAKPAQQLKPKPNDTEDVARQNYANLMAQAQSASDPRMRQQFESLARSVLAKAGLEPEGPAA